MERHSAVPGAAGCEYLVRLAPGEGDQAVLARPERAGDLHLAEGAHQRHQLQYTPMSRPLRRSSTTCSTGRWTSRFPGSANHKCWSLRSATPRLSYRPVEPGCEALSWALRDWTYSGVLRYQSGQLLQSPDSANNLLSNLGSRTGEQSGRLGRRLHVLEPGARPASVPGGSQFQVRSNQAVGAQSEGVGGTAVWHVRNFRSLLQ